MTENATCQINLEILIRGEQILVPRRNARLQAAVRLAKRKIFQMSLDINWKMSAYFA